MTTGRLLIAALVGVICYLALVLLAARLSPVRDWNVRLDRGTAIERARDAARRFEIDPAGWRVYVDAHYGARADRYLDTYGRAAADAARLSPLTSHVLFVEPEGQGRRLRIELNADGRLISAARSTGEPSPKPLEVGAGDDPGRTTAKDGDSGGFKIGVNDGTTNRNRQQDAVKTSGEVDLSLRPVADDAIRRLLGAEDFQTFEFVSAATDKIRDVRGARFRYERKPGDATPELKIVATCFVADGEWREASLTTEYDAGFSRTYDAQSNRNSGLRGTMAFLLFLAFLVLPVLYFRALLRGRIRHKQAFVLFAIVFVLTAAANIVDDAIDASFVENWRTGGQARAIGEAALETLVPSFFVALGFALTWSVGFVFARRFVPLGVASFVALLRGKAVARFVGASAASGVFLGGALALAPHLFLWSGIAPGFEVARPTAQMFVARVPALSALIELPGFALFMLFACFVPALHRYARLRRFMPLLVLPACALLFVDAPSRLATAWSVIAVACLMSIIAYDIFRYYDLLALLIALASATIGSSAVALLATDAPALRSSGWVVLASLGAIALAGTGVHFFGTPAKIEDEIQLDPSDELANTRRAERERLRAEFGVARQAQERMLPHTAPRIPGYTIAASCKPAREVGGDLYDFIRLPDERIGIVVADVSGKGVPAALYMTLTKGLLASIAEVESDPRRMLCEANKHLFQVCRRKTFVTLILGVLDPPTGELTLARAGHNPTVWRRAAANEVRLLQSPGLGLGLNKGVLFDRTLQVETIRLDAGDAVVFYSDGVTEAMNVRLEEYGEDRLQQIVSKTDGMNAGRTEQAILADVHGFLGDEAPQDDVTVVVLRVDDDRSQV